MLFICTINEADIEAEDVMICPLTLADWSVIAELHWIGKKDGVGVYQPFFKIFTGTSFCHDGMANGASTFVNFMYPTPGEIAITEKGKEVFLTEAGFPSDVPNTAFSLDGNNKSLRLNNLNIWRNDFVGIGADFRAAMVVMPSGQRKVTIQIAYDEIN